MDRDGRTEPVVGAPGADGGQGRLHILPGTAARPTTKDARRIGPAALGIGGADTELGGHLLG
ncbi:hypothetical protein [Actinomadura sp. NEAU-AAG7]|uniref:hypothetical protein n=1 Tax=Actinomadura sp. NEAU-AAG7 TaxID=2839640 RepID=UPI0035AFFE16